MITYAQNFEDVLLERCFRNLEKGFYIDAGAWDPVLDSVTKHFYERGWNGINVEPSREYAIRLLQDRPRDITLNAALGDAIGRAPFYNLSESRLSTLSPATLEQLAPFGFAVNEGETQILTLRHVCELYVNGDIHFLKIDVEGMEKEVISGADWSHYRPWVLLVEATVPFSQTPAWDNWEPMLLQAGYVFTLFDGLNRYYVRTENTEFLEHFKTPPNCTDMFVPYKTVSLERELDNLKSSASTDTGQENVNARLDRLHAEWGGFLSARIDGVVNTQAVTNTEVAECKSRLGQTQDVNARMLDIVNRQESQFTDVALALTKSQGQQDRFLAKLELQEAQFLNMRSVFLDRQQEHQAIDDHLSQIVVKIQQEISKTLADFHAAQQTDKSVFTSLVAELRGYMVPAQNLSFTNAAGMQTSNESGALEQLRQEHERLQTRLRIQRESHQATIEQLAYRINQSAQEIRTLTDAGTRMASETRDLLTQRQHLEQELSSMRENVGQLRRALQGAQHEAVALRASVSWRVTAPLRTVFGLFVRP